MSRRKDVYELLCLYEGPNPREAFKPTYTDGPPRDRRDNVWITDDPKNGRWLVFRSQVPRDLEPAYEIALGDGLLERYLLKKEDQLSLYESHGIPLSPQDEPWTVYPANADAIVVLTDKGLADITRYRTKSPILSDRLKVDVKGRTITLDGCKHEITSNRALLLIKVLLEHPDEWIIGKRLHDGEYGDDYIGLGRPDKVKHYLTEGILSVLEAQRGAGFRLRL